jgi:hypothetical protein
MYFSLVHQLDQPTGKPIEPTAPALDRTMHAPTEPTRSRESRSSRHGTQPTCAGRSRSSSRALSRPSPCKPTDPVCSTILWFDQSFLIKRQLFYESELSLFCYKLNHFIYSAPPFYDFIRHFATLNSIIFFATVNSVIFLLVLSHFTMLPVLLLQYSTIF